MQRGTGLFVALAIGTSLPSIAIAQNAEATPAEEDPSTMSADEIFKKMFGKERPPVAAGKYAVIIDGMNAGIAQIDPSPEGWIETRYLKAVVFPLLLEDARAKVLPVLSGERTSFAALKSVGIEQNFDPGPLVMTLSIPMDMRSQRILPLNPPHVNASVEFVEQADISAYASFRGGFDVIEQSRSESGLTGFATDIDLGLNVKGIVAQARLRYEDGRNRKLSRGDVRLTYDDVSSLVRYELGDLSVNRRPFQVAPRIAGIAAYREYRINPYLDYRTSGEKAFELEISSRVEVFVNGAPVRTFSLGAGRYLLKDLPLVSSANNDVEIRITAATGEQRTIAFPAFTDIDLLETGRTEFALNVGVPYRDEDGVRVYDENKFNIMGFVRRGLSDTLTAGVSLEADNDLALVGGEISWASPIGTFNISGGMDVRRAGTSSSRLTAQYAWRDADYSRGRFVDAQIVLTGEDYRTLDGVLNGAPSAIFARARAGQSLAEDLRLQISGSYERVRDPKAGERWSVGTTLFKQLGPVSLTGSLDYGQDRGKNELIGRLSLFVPLGRGTLSTSYATKDNVLRADYIRTVTAGAGSFGYNLGVERRDGANRQFARATYVGNRFDAAIQQSRTSTNGNVDIRTGVAFGTALVMADGAFGWSRPIVNSFAIVENAGGEGKLAIEPRSGLGGGDVRYSAYADALGPGVVPDLPPYYERQIEAVAISKEQGASGGDIFHLKPGLRSGYRLKVGAGVGSVSTLGVLVGRNGAPLMMITGEARKVGAAEDSPPALLFTNASGRFFLEGMEAGQSYDIIASVNGEPVRFRLDVPKDVKGIWKPVDPITLDVEQVHEKK